jgi:hypothetical protein
MSKEMNKKIKIIGIGIVVMVLLAGCQFGTGAGRLLGNSQSPLDTATVAMSTPLPADTPTPQPTSDPITPTPTVDPAIQSAEDTVQAYFAALENGDFSAASRQVSAFSLMVNTMTAGEVAEALTQQSLDGAVWSGLQIEDAQVFDAKTVLVHVTYELAAPDPQSGKTVKAEQDELWPVRLENGRWLYNWTNVIDFKTLNLDYQETAGLTIAPQQITRYSDKLRLTVLAQNGTNDPIVIGQTNQVLATFHFGDQSLDAIDTRYVFDRLQTYENVNIDLPGLYTRYPDSVDIVKYKDYQVAPWFTFNLGQ